LEIASGLLVAAAIGCFAVAGWFDHRKHTLSGVPSSHFAVNENGRLFHVHRGGPPVEQRPHFPLTAERYRLWEENERSGSRWAGWGALCFFAGVGFAAWSRLARSPLVAAKETPG
jgi:hypothetical protein